MTGTWWSLVALGGLAVVALANLLRARRTEDRGCLGELFVPAERMTAVEQVMNRGGIALFAAGVVLALVY